MCKIINVTIEGPQGCGKSVITDYLRAGIISKFISKQRAKKVYIIPDQFGDEEYLQKEIRKAVGKATASGVYSESLLVVIREKQQAEKAPQDVQLSFDLQEGGK